VLIAHNTLPKGGLMLVMHALYNLFMGIYVI